MTVPLLRISGLRLEIDGRPVLRGVDLSVAESQVAGLVGESGAGKSMVGRVVLGLYPGNARVTGGQVRFGTRDLLDLGAATRESILGREIALIPQNPMTALNPVERIERQISDVLRMHLALRASGARARSLELLDAVQIRDPQRVLRQYPHELSGGMRQRILIAIAFACGPRLVIADEPTTALDVTVQKQCLRLIRTLQRRHGTAVLFISHDLGVVAKVCDTVSVMHSGRVVEAASAAQLFAAPTHAYTRALLAATPRFDRPGEALAPIPEALGRELLEEAVRLDRQRAS
ncbi:MAG: ABC transporter ATP-binding protein [Betaproteobacteria bacterium]